MILSLENIHKSYTTGTGKVNVLNGANLQVMQGEKVAVIGQSGSGKSTLLHIAGLLDKANKGKVSISGIDSNSLKDSAKSEIRNKAIGFVYQQHHLLSDFTALENILMPAIIAGEKSKFKNRANELLEKIGLTHRANHYPTQLSGGEAQRVAIARALLMQPKLLLADEPTGSLDPSTAADVSLLFDNLVESENLTLLLVTHNEALAGRCDKVYKMANGVLELA